MAITALNKNTSASSNDTIFNPKSQLDKDAFMMLFLKELEMQDPTDPMDTEKMLEQTAYLSTMEMNTNMQNTLNNLSKTLQSTSDLSSINAIGKMADLAESYLNVSDDDKSKTFELYFPKDIVSGEIQIKDKNGNVIKTFPLESHTKGVLSFDWDLTDNEGQRVNSDSYEVTATFTSTDGNTYNTALGEYPIESIRFENGEVYAKLGSQYYPFSQIKEIYELNY